jgi:hypothetical protein
VERTRWWGFVSKEGRGKFVRRTTFIRGSITNNLPNYDKNDPRKCEWLETVKQVNGGQSRDFGGIFSF